MASIIWLMGLLTAGLGNLVSQIDISDSKLDSKTVFLSDRVKGIT